jgi:hypothetical protein
VLTRTAIVMLSATILACASSEPAESASKARGARSHGPVPTYNYRHVRRGYGGGTAVYVRGRYSGSDPDPFIRSMLARDPPWAQGL